MILQYNKKDCKNTDEIVFQCIFNENCNPVIVNKCNYFTRRETGHGCKTMIPAFLVSALDNCGSGEVVVTEQALSQCVQDCHKVHVCWKQKCLYNILGGVLNPNSFGGYLTICSLFVNNCK